MWASLISNLTLDFVSLENDRVKVGAEETMEHSAEIQKILSLSPSSQVALGKLSNLSIFVEGKPYHLPHGVVVDEIKCLQTNYMCE